MFASCARRGLLLALLFAAPAVLAEAPIVIDYDAIRKDHPLPGDAAVADALRKLRPTIDKALAAPPASAPNIPKIRAAPPALPDRPAEGTDILAPKVLSSQAAKVPPLNVEELVRAARVAAKGTSPDKLPRDNEFFVFLSLSIPDHKLRQLIEQAADWKATVVFRGPVDETDMSGVKLGLRLKNLEVRNAGDVQIHPPLFTRFAVTQVPAYVLARIPESQNEQDGCAPASAYARVDGDVTPEFALRLMRTRADGDLKEIAERYLAGNREER